MARNSSSRFFIPMAHKYDRVILLVDMDCFYCQVEEKLDGSLNGQPLAVVQYNAWRGGGIIAVNYAARSKGVTRHMRGDEAKAQCPEIRLIKVPNVREKADLTKYREAGKEVANVLQRFASLLERASVDEAYLDISESVNKRLVEMNEGKYILQPSELVSTYAVGFDSIGEFVTTISHSYTNPLMNNVDIYRNFNESERPALRSSNIRLLIGASIASEIRAAVKAETNYECSAGIAHNKVLAKLACGMNKPNKQTLLPLCEVENLFQTMPLGKIRGLGAKFGEDVCGSLGIRFLGQLLKFTEVELQKKFDEKSGSWLFNICRGIDLEAVTPRINSKSIGCCKKFPGRNNITGINTLLHWLSELANEISERLKKDIIENNRRARQLVVSFIQEINSEEISSSRSTTLNAYDSESISRSSLDIIKSNTKQLFRTGSGNVLQNPLKFLGLSVGKFEPIINRQNSIKEMFAQQADKKTKISVGNQPEDLELETAQKFISDTLEVQSIKKQSCKLKGDIKTFFTNQAKQKSMQTKKDQIFSEAKSCSTDIAKKEQTSLQASPSKSFFKNCVMANIIHIEQQDDSHLPNYIPTAIQSVQERKNVTKIDLSDDSDGELIDFVAELELLQNESEKEKDWKLEKKSHSETPSTNLGIKRKFSDIANSEQIGKDYRSGYAEFATPELRPEFIQYTNCSKCSAKILNEKLSLQTHEDHHLAQDLSQKQRMEFREHARLQINYNIDSINIVNKKKKSSIKHNLKILKKENITKFLRPTTSILDSNLIQPTKSELSICEICKKPIKQEEVSEHKDFHVAKEIQRKLNRLEVHTVEMSKKSVPGKSVPGKKIKNYLTGASHAAANVKPITQYFLQPDE